MISSGPLGLAIAALVGALLGAFHFGGLWWTVRRIASARRPAALALASYIVRLAVVGAGLFLVMDGRWERLAAALAGLLVARFVVVRRTVPGAVARDAMRTGEARWS